MEPNIYLRAAAADAALNALGRDITDAETETCDALILSAYRSEPDSLTGIVNLADAVLAIEGDTLEPVIQDVLRSIRDAAKRLSN